jgi:hypothetical protein
MFNSTTLEVAIGMAFVYLLLSLFCTAINEGIAGILGSRAKNLEKGIKSLFTEGLVNVEVKVDNVIKTKAVTLADAIYNHGLVQSLYRSGKGDLENAARSLPSYIPSRVFASALLDVIFPDDKANPTGLPTTLESMLAKLQSLPESKGKEAMMTLVKQANGDIDATREAFEQWYDDAMDRAAGWYKRNTQMVLFVLGLGIAISLNVDSIAVGRSLWTSPALRSYAIAAAENYAKQHPIGAETAVSSGGTGNAHGAATPASDATSAAVPDGSTAPATIAGTGSPQRAVQLLGKASGVQMQNASTDLAALQSLSLPIGWSDASTPWKQKDPRTGVLFAVVGWLLTAMAMTLGAPFWFDLLNQFMVVRSTIKPREKSEVEKSKDGPKK